MAAKASEQVRALRDLADRIERGADVLPEELVERLQMAGAIDEVIDAHEAILTALAK